jgi:hypothetical protein
MTNYNDGLWHGWNGGECPVHEDSTVEGIYLNGGKPTDESPVIDYAGQFDWRREEVFDLVAFRVVKEYREPREFWVNVYETSKFAYGTKDAADLMAQPLRIECIHVREVRE